MACVNPLIASKLSDGRKVFTPRAGDDVVCSMYMACGKCALCRTYNAAQWRTRMVHEASMHRDTSVLTLTYDDEHLPPYGSLCKRHMQLFVKQVRNVTSRRDDPDVRFGAVAEYSPELLRPHYHVILFGYWPPDARYFNESRAGNVQFTSEEVTRLWGRGLVTFQYFTPGAAGYIAGHDSAKVLNPGFAAKSRSALDHQEPEFRLMSRNPGLGAGFFEKYGRQMMAVGFAVVDGRRVPIPRFYIGRGEDAYPELTSDLKAERELAALKAMPDETRERLRAREICARARVVSQSRGGVAR